MERTIKYNDHDVKGTEVRFDTVREEWNVYELKDGSTLKVKVVVAGVMRINGEYTREGDPEYQVKNTVMIVVVDAPEHLRKK